MSGILTIVSAVLQIILLLVSKHLAVSAEEKKKKEELLKEFENAVANGDTSAITALFSKLR